jgi:hypothetical protein
MRACSSRSGGKRGTTSVAHRSPAWLGSCTLAAVRLILVDVVETRATLDSYQVAIPDAEALLVRLHADLATLHQRLADREDGAGLIWHQQRAGELITLMEQAQLEDLLVNTIDRSALDIAGEIIAGSGWIAR